MQNEFVFKISNAAQLLMYNASKVKDVDKKSRDHAEFTLENTSASFQRPKFRQIRRYDVLSGTFARS